MKSRVAHIREDRSGMAPFEFVLVFPIFLAMLCCAMWVAAMMIGKSRVTVSARHQADEQRVRGTSSSAGSTPFDFSEVNEGRVVVREEQSVQFSGIMPIGHPNAFHAVLINTWDYEELAFDEVPDYELAMQLATSGPPNGLGSQLKALRALLTGLGEWLGNMASILQFHDLSSFLTEFPAAVESLPDSPDGAQGGDLFDIDQVSEAKRLYDTIKRMLGEVKTRKRIEARKAAQEARQTSTGVRRVSLAFESIPASMNQVGARFLENMPAPDEQAALARIQRALSEIDSLIPPQQTEDSSVQVLNDSLRTVVSVQSPGSVDTFIEQLRNKPPLSDDQRAKIKSGYLQAINQHRDSFGSFRTSAEQTLRKLRSSLERDSKEEQAVAFHVLQMIVSTMNDSIQKAETVAESTQRVADKFSE